jgi:hypothetical protein
MASARSASPTHIRDLTPDRKNRRKHTPRNVGAIVSSLQAVGAARSIVIDEHGEVLAGNATVEAAAEAGITRLLVVEADGQTLVAVRRRGLTPAEKRRLAIDDNRAAELAAWDLEQLNADLGAGLALNTWWRPDELEALLAPLTPAGETPGGNAAGDAGNDAGTPGKGAPPGCSDDIRQEQYAVVVVCGSAEQQEAVYAELTAAGHTCKVVTT